MALSEQLRKPLKACSVSELEALAAEIRETVIQTVETNGGHLSPNLGMVELTLALYFAFDFPADKLLFDVGHQSYVHKIISDRAERFSTLRKKGGISGFPSPEESAYDAFGRRSCGNSLAAGLGFAKARDLAGEALPVVTVVGDGSLINGESLEALTPTEKKPGQVHRRPERQRHVHQRKQQRLLQGALQGHYRQTLPHRQAALEERARQVLGGAGAEGVQEHGQAPSEPPRISGGLRVQIRRGVLDGHNLKELIQVFENIRDSEEAVFVHVRTVKGKGLKPAEEKSDYYHGLSVHFESGENAYAARLGEALARRRRRTGRSSP